MGSGEKARRGCGVLGVGGGFVVERGTEGRVETQLESVARDVLRDLCAYVLKSFVFGRAIFIF